MTDFPPTPPPLPGHPLDYRDSRLAQGSVGGGGGANIGPLAYAPPRRLFSVLRFTISIIVMLILAGIFMLVVPRLESVYMDFGVKLPAVTMIVLDVSRFLRTPLGWFFATLIAAVVGVFFAVLPVGGRWLRLLMVTMLALIVLGLALAVLLPFVNLMESLSGGRGKR